ncbi:hypothetical protein CSA37_03415 [Candidatus Fermentibacteria bacterium]|nr:MAG: hypothetical protein CSA37_03415 [Candidatus Fermentibacteria bacterium]
MSQGQLIAKKHHCLTTTTGTTRIRFEHCFFFPVFQKSPALPASPQKKAARKGHELPAAGLNTNTLHLLSQPLLQMEQVTAWKSAEYEKNQSTWDGANAT